MAEDDALMESTDVFKKLLSSKWPELVSHRALKPRSHYRGRDCLHVLAKRPEDLRSTQLTNHAITLSQDLHFKNNKPDQVADFLGHDTRVHLYRLPTRSTTQLAKISKVLLSKETGNLDRLQGKSLEEIKLEDEIIFRDAEEKDCENKSEDVNGTPTATGFASSSSINTQQVQDTEDGEGKIADRKNEGRRGKKKTWSKAEIAAIMRHFKEYINKGKLAPMKECRHCKLVEGSVLAQRTVQNIRDFVRNRGVAAKKKLK
ncbi:uncharacterized protein LOC130906058 [Corythoichthys intestinalis]|uniref:uncharacterized protein LOC130906058 n=1 Tax=Corythoichthys intestinalis TaxID=161448 RepID=UPI0025A5C4D0|nr:uncharacterized protein LOC130906058 [Corythoichthys intestinalis]